MKKSRFQSLPSPSSLPSLPRCISAAGKPFKLWRKDRGTCPTLTKTYLISYLCVSWYFSPRNILFLAGRDESSSVGTTVLAEDKNHCTQCPGKKHDMLLILMHLIQYINNVGIYSGKIGCQFLSGHPLQSYSPILPSWAFFTRPRGIS